MNNEQNKIFGNYLKIARKTIRIFVYIIRNVHLQVKRKREIYSDRVTITSALGKLIFRCKY